MPSKKTIRLTTNFNGKIQCDYFIDIRRNKLEVSEGEVAEIFVVDCGVRFDVKVVRIIPTKISMITDLVAFLSMGQDKAYFIDYMQRSYSDDVRKGFLYLYLYHRMDRELPF